MAGTPRPKGWTCSNPHCRRWNENRRLRSCPECGRKRRVRRSKHARLLEAHRPLYARLLEHQGGRCPLCLTEPSSDRKLDMDHDHRAMVVRGLLCHKCNRQLPAWVTPQWLRAAADYLDNPPAASLPSVSGDESGRVAA